MSTIDEGELDRLEGLYAASTGGEWVHGHFADDDHSCNCKSIVSDYGYMGAICTIEVDNGLSISDGGNDAPPAEEAKANLRIIAAMHNAFPALLAAARAFSAEKAAREEAERRALVAEENDKISREYLEIDAKRIKAVEAKLTTAEAETARLRKRVKEMEEVHARVLRWAEARCPCHDETPDPCPLCGASVENLEGCKSAENTLPPGILGDLRRAAAIRSRKENNDAK